MPDDINDNKPPEGLDEFLAAPAMEAPSMDAADAQAMSPDGTPAGLDEFIGQELKEEKYGSLGQQALTALEGAGVGASFGLSTGIEKALGVTPEDMQGRKEVNPGLHMAGEVAGLAGSALIPVAGQANIMAKVGQAGAKAVGLGAAKSGFMNQVGHHAVRGAFEGALFQGGDEVSKMFMEDPTQSAETAIADIGLATVLGGVFGGAFGAAAQGLKKVAPGKFVSELDQVAVDAGDFKANVEASDLLKPEQKKGILEGLMEQKPEAAEIKAAAKRLGADVMEGMTSASRDVQMMEDSLLNGAQTISGIKRRQLYADGFRKATGAIDEAVGAEGVYSKAELGNLMKDTIVKQIDEQNAPIAALYNEIKQYHAAIPLSEKSGPAIARNIGRLPEFKLSPSSPEAQLAKRVMNEIENLKTVDDVKTYKSILTRSVSPTASSGEKRMVSILADKLTDLEESSIERFAKSQMKSPQAKERIMGLIEQRKEANGQYKAFINKVQTLSEQLGKGRVYGVQDAINFIKELTPEQVTTRLFSKNNSEFLRFFAKEFPEQMELMKNYQKSALRDAASKTGELSPKVLFNNINKLEPEIQKVLFNPKELQALRDAETYIRAFPKNFNPSGTSGMSAAREFFQSPTGMAIGNARDFAIEKFIKLVNQAPEINNAVSLGQSTVKGWKTTAKAVKGVFEAGKDTLPSNVIPLITKREKLAKLVEEYNKNPDKLFQIGDNNPVEEYGQAFAATSSRAVQYLNTLRPDIDPKSPLDAKMPANSTQTAAYNRALDIAQQPLVVLQHIKDGQLTPQDVVTLKTIYPGLYDQLSQKLTNQMMNQVHKGETIPYQTRIGLSMFLGQALDSSLTSVGITSAQPSQEQQAQREMSTGKAPAASSMKGLEKMPQQYRTPSQAAEMGGQTRNK